MPNVRATPCFVHFALSNAHETDTLPMRSLSSFLLFAILMGCLWPASPVHGQEKDALFPMQKKTKWGFINAQGEWEIQPQYPQVLSFSEGLAAARKAGGYQWGFLNENGEWSIPPSYPKEPAAYQRYAGLRFYNAPVDPFRGKYAAALSDTALVLIDKKGGVVNSFPEYDLIRPFHEGLAAFGKNDKRGFINEKWEVVISLKYEEVGNFHEGLAYAQKSFGDPYGYLDKNGDWALKPQFEEVGPFNNGLAPVKKGAFKPYGYINKDGEWQIEPNFEDASAFSEGLAFVTTKEKKTKKYIGKNGKTKIASPLNGFKICHGHPFERGLALVSLVKKGEECGRVMRLFGAQRTVTNAALAYINKSGDIVYRQSLKNGRYLAQVQDSIDAAERRAEKRQEKAEARRERKKLAQCADYKALGDTTAGSYVEIGYRGVTRRYYYNNDVFEKKGPDKFVYHIPRFQHENGGTFLDIRPITLEPSFMNEDELEAEDLSYRFSLGRAVFGRGGENQNPPDNECIQFPSDATEDGSISNVTKKGQSLLWERGQIKYINSENSKNYILINADPDHHKTPPESIGEFILSDGEKVPLKSEDKLTFIDLPNEKKLKISGTYSIEMDEGGTSYSGFRATVPNFDGTTGKYVSEPVKKSNDQYVSIEYYHVLAYSDDKVHVKHYQMDFTKEGVNPPDGKMTTETLPFTEKHLIGEYKGGGAIRMAPVKYTIGSN